MARPQRTICPGEPWTRHPRSLSSRDLAPRRPLTSTKSGSQGTKPSRRLAAPLEGMTASERSFYSMKVPSVRPARGGAIPVGMRSATRWTYSARFTRRADRGSDAFLGKGERHCTGQGGPEFISQDISKGRRRRSNSTVVAQGREAGIDADEPACRRVIHRSERNECDPSAKVGRMEP